MDTSEAVMLGFLLGMSLTTCIFIATCCSAFYYFERPLLHNDTCELIGGTYIGSGWITCDSGFTLEGNKKPLCRVEDDILFFDPKDEDGNDQIKWVSRESVCGGDQK